MYPDPNVGPLWEIPLESPYAYITLGHSPRIPSEDNTLQVVMVTGDHPDTARAIACGAPQGWLETHKKSRETMR